MGRSEKPIPPGVAPQIAQLATGLRVQRHQAGLSYQELAGRTNYSAATLAAAASGTKLPSKAATLAFVKACDGDVEAWTRRWVLANAELHGVFQPPDPTKVSSPLEFGQCLRQLMLWNGLCTLDEIAEGTDVRRSSVNRVLSGETVPSANTLRKLLAGTRSVSYTDDWQAARVRILGLPSTIDEVFADRSTRAHLDTTVNNASSANVEKSPYPAAHQVVKPDFDIRSDVLLNELKQLRKGQGVESPNLAADLGPSLRQLAGASDSDWTRVRAKLYQLLTQAAAELPDDMRTAIVFAFGLPAGDPGMRYRTFGDRMMMLSREIDRDERTSRRRVDEAILRLTEVLMRHPTAE